MSLWKFFFTVEGRLNRKGFWQGVVSCLLILFLVANVFPVESWFLKNTTAIIALFFLVFVGYCFSVIVIKRLHDRNRSGMAMSMIILPVLCYFVSGYSNGFLSWALGRFLPLFFIMLFILDWGVFKGIDKNNKYGKQGLSMDWRKIKG